MFYNYRVEMGMEIRFHRIILFYDKNWNIMFSTHSCKSVDAFMYTLY